MSQDIQKLIQHCPVCAKNAPVRYEPLMPSSLAKYPWQKVGSDLFLWKNETYIIVVDYYSQFPEILRLSFTTSQGVIRALKNIFSRHGIPETLFSDNGPQYDSKEFSDFAKHYNFHHVTSSPHYPQSNGLAERAIQTVKKLLKESDNPFMALLNYGTTPFPWCNLGPAELLMGRRLHSNLPLSKEQLIPVWPYLEEFARQDNKFKQRQKHDYDKRHRVTLFLMTLPCGLKQMAIVALVLLQLKTLPLIHTG